jgi:hypothetical protein
LGFDLSLWRCLSCCLALRLLFQSSLKCRIGARVDLHAIDRRQRVIDDDAIAWREARGDHGEAALLKGDLDRGVAESILGVESIDQACSMTCACARASARV